MPDSVLEHQACALVRRARLSWGFCIMCGNNGQSVGGLVDEFPGPRQHTEYTGTGPGGLVAHIGRGGAVCALSLLDLVSSLVPSRWLELVTVTDWRHRESLLLFLRVRT